MADLPKQLPPDVAAALSSGNLIEAIKLLRGKYKYNIGLAEAKAFLETMHKQAEARAQMQAPGKPAQHAQAGMRAGHHTPHTAATLHADPHLSPGEVPRSSSGALFAALVVAIVFVIGTTIYFS